MRPRLHQACAWKECRQRHVELHHGRPTPVRVGGRWRRRGRQGHVHEEKVHGRHQDGPCRSRGKTCGVKSSGRTRNDCRSSQRAEVADPRRPLRAERGHPKDAPPAARRHGLRRGRRPRGRREESARRHCRRRLLHRRQEGHGCVGAARPRRPRLRRPHHRRRHRRRAWWRGAPLHRGVLPVADARRRPQARRGQPGGVGGPDGAKTAPPPWRPTKAAVEESKRPPRRRLGEGHRVAATKSDLPRAPRPPGPGAAAERGDGRGRRRA